MAGWNPAMAGWSAAGSDDEESTAGGAAARAARVPNTRLGFPEPTGLAEREAGRRALERDRMLRALPVTVIGDIAVRMVDRSLQQEATQAAGAAPAAAAKRPQSAPPQRQPMVSPIKRDTDWARRAVARIPSGGPVPSAVATRWGKAALAEETARRAQDTERELQRMREEERSGCGLAAIRAQKLRQRQKTADGKKAVLHMREQQVAALWLQLQQAEAALAKERAAMRDERFALAEEQKTLQHERRQLERWARAEREGLNRERAELAAQWDELVAARAYGSRLHSPPQPAARLPPRAPSPGPTVDPPD
eukprot:TRINITY_DN25474_c0_g1_i1.p2 TRINITY_DN25474_c0_g1~~TRINITY_DN25474_c0_g1_i1.p2  ORF type:complete len:331 (+),score=103.21 TRINITY_DN25474_c0_g1_i1:72-995(+)